MLLFLICFFFTFKNNVCQTNYLNIYGTGLQIFRMGRTVAVDDLKLVFDPSRDIAMATNYCHFYPHN